jgi:hypothetical protein
VVATVIESATALIFNARELDNVSKALVEVEKAIEVLEPQVEDFLESFIANLYDECQDKGERLPPEDVRKALANKALPSELKAQYRAHLATRRRCKSRLADLREIVAAHRSIVSAAKTELEASEGPQPQWS